jgi:hypothetical protein
MYVQYQFFYLTLTRQTSAEKEKLNQLTVYHHLCVIQCKVQYIHHKIYPMQKYHFAVILIF